MRPDVKAPGLTWNERKDGSWEARWQANSKIVKRGYEVKSRKVWEGFEPSEAEVAFIIDRCQSLQDEMHAWGRGGAPHLPKVFDGTIDALVACYQTDEFSPFHEVRYHTRRYYIRMCRRITNDIGARRISEIRVRDIKQWHGQIVKGGKVSMGHAAMTMLRILLSFGVTILEDDDCAKLSLILSKMKFPNTKPREAVLTTEHVIAIRAAAHAAGLHSIALAQALQFECIMRQKDIIGEWVPIPEDGISEVTRRGQKWLRGLRWEEIDANLILRHTTSKRQKDIEIDLKQSPMVIEEFRKLKDLPEKGPIVICEETGLPWDGNKFRRNWRDLATSVGVPKTVRNMDSRAGAISEATDAGANLEHVRHAATHSDIQMTQRYSRNATEKTASVQRARAAFRTKNTP